MMNTAAPRLPEVERLSTELADQIAGASPPYGVVWHVEGAPTAGKSVFLRALSGELAARGLKPVEVAPPPRSLDAGPIALLETGVGLAKANGLDGELSGMVEAEVGWSEKVASVREWLDEAPDEVVILCDDPFSWVTEASLLDHFSARAYDVARLLVSSSRLRRAFVGRVPEGVPRRTSVLAQSSDPYQWLSDDEAWGGLVGSARELRDTSLDLASFSPLQIRLMVAHVALRSADDLLSWLPEDSSRRGLALRLFERVNARKSLRDLARLWGELSVVRRPFELHLLNELGAAELSDFGRSILLRSLLFRRDDGFYLHETLRNDARKAWLARNLEREANVHARVAKYYVERFKEQRSTDPEGALIVEMEAFHHAASSNDDGLRDQCRVFFSDQLNTLGRWLSHRQKRYDDAAAVFERALKWDDRDDYAHHYLAFNYDAQGRDPDKVEQHYRKALALNPDQDWWHSRLISFLVTRGRIDDAREAWNDALDTLAGGESVPSELYEELHLWVARLLLHRGELDFAGEVLKDIPGGVRERVPEIHALIRRLRALTQSAEYGSVVPGYLADRQWWKEPRLLPTTVFDGKRLMRWLAGRVESVARHQIVIVAVEVDAGAKLPGEVVRTSVSFDEFDRWSGDEIEASMVRPGTFLELGLYSGGGNKTEMLKRLHPRDEWQDPELPWLEHDPARYLRHTFTLSA